MTPAKWRRWRSGWYRATVNDPNRVNAWCELSVTRTEGGWVGRVSRDHRREIAESSLCDSKATAQQWCETYARLGVRT